MNFTTITERRKAAENRPRLNFIGRILKRYDISPDDVRQAVLELRGGQ
jgi:hypothetical protein